MSLGIAMHFVCQNNEVTDSGSHIMNDCIFPEKYRDTETMLQNYLANEDEKKTRDDVEKVLGNNKNVDYVQVCAD